MSKNQNLEEILTEISNNPEMISRRDAFKLLTISPIAASVLAGTTISTSTLSASESQEHIVIVGAGAGGVMMAARMSRKAPNAKITIIAPNEVHLYQPGQVFMAAGLYTLEDIHLFLAM
jgi:sulfide:quinone oxidoreductase